MSRAALLCLAVVGILASVSLSAHHSFAATYLEDNKVTIKGTLVQFMLRNPHSFVQVQAPDDKGQMQRWAVEWAAGPELSRDGVNRDTLTIGDEVIVTGNPGRTAEDHRLRLLSIERPKDGWKWNGDFQ
jgi:Family of unknown function (DUF6152)